VCVKALSEPEGGEGGGEKEAERGNTYNFSRVKSGIKHALAGVKKEWGSPSSLLEGGLAFFLKVRSTVMPLV
jgi:hypothetical protein